MAMKKSLKYFIIPVFIIGYMTIVQPSYGDAPGPPAGGHGQSNDQGPVGAPIDGGLTILLAMGAGYGGMKFYKTRKEKKEIRGRAGKPSELAS